MSKLTRSQTSGNMVTQERSAKTQLMAKIKQISSSTGPMLLPYVFRTSDANVTGPDKQHLCCSLMTVSCHWNTNSQGGVFLGWPVRCHSRCSLFGFHILLLADLLCLHFYPPPPHSSCHRLLWPLVEGNRDSFGATKFGRTLYKNKLNKTSHHSSLQLNFPIRISSIASVKKNFNWLATWFKQFAKVLARNEFSENNHVSG